MTAPTSPTPCKRASSCCRSPRAAGFLHPREALPLTGEWVQIAGEFNANGIEATRTASTLIVVNSEVGTLYAVDPENGEATAIDLGGASVTSGDGLLLRGRTSTSSATS